MKKENMHLVPNALFKKISLWREAIFAFCFMELKSVH